MAKRSAVVAEVDGRQLELSNLDTVLYPSVSYPSYAMGAELARCRADLSRAYMRDGFHAAVLAEVSRLAKLAQAAQSDGVSKSYIAFTLDRIVAEVERPLPGEMR